VTDALAPSKILCVGRNYAAHASELGGEVPPEPLVFMKPPSSLIRSGDAILRPGDVGRVDFEGEIGVIIGRRARNISESEAWSHVSGVCPVNDVTARDLQRKDSQWTRAKGFDTFCAVGPVTPIQEVDPEALTVVTRVNGVQRQRGQVDEMAYSIPFVIAWLSRVMTLEPGDLLATGTPEGVGPIVAGDVVEVELVGISLLRNPVVEAAQV
jgi:2-keto-4-pentenoate hydratase/2-oxohepta-3-ene-1,7-dioic acid hydratase in catechol pathway